MLPKHISKYFWDLNPKKLSLERDKEFITERILEYGDTAEFSWLQKTYDKQEIIKVLKKSRRISPKTGNYFALYYNIPKQELECIRKPFTQKQNRF